jgi:hypothetical protein
MSETGEQYRLLPGNSAVAPSPLKMSRVTEAKFCVVDLTSAKQNEAFCQLPFCDRPFDSPFRPCQTLHPKYFIFRILTNVPFRLACH